MALKILMLRSKMERLNKELETLREKDAEFATREAELEQAVSEAATEEEEKVVAENVERFETEKQAHDERKNAIEQEIGEIEGQIKEIEANAPTRGNNPNANPESKHNERGETNKMNIANSRSLPKSQRVFDALSGEQRQAILADNTMQEFLKELRSMKGQQRAVSGAELTIPVVMLDLIAENMYRYSKLLNRVRVRNVRGEARQTIAGTVPEAVWTEMCGVINELSFVFNQITLDGYKVAGFVPVCNSDLEDNDVNLAGWIVEMLSEAVGLAMDKAILYGKGAASKMPLGIVTRLAQTVQPSDYPANAPAWVDLHTSNVIKIDGTTSTGAEFWAKLMEAIGNTYTRYSRGEMFWAMNSKTYAKLRSKLITFTATGDVVANLYGTLPVITGNVDVLEFIPDGDIIGGYCGLYFLGPGGGGII